MSEVAELWKAYARVTDKLVKLLREAEGDFSHSDAPEAGEWLDRAAEARREVDELKAQSNAGSASAPPTPGDAVWANTCPHCEHPFEVVHGEEPGSFGIYFTDTKEAVMAAKTPPTEAAVDLWDEERQAWQSVCALLRETGAVTEADCKSWEGAEPTTIGQRLFGAIRAWGLGRRVDNRADALPMEKP